MTTLSHATQPPQALCGIQEHVLHVGGVESERMTNLIVWEGLL
jgi:hypothetical protein